MSGHSKWSQIKHQKGAADQKRGQLFTKLGHAIAIAVRESGGVSDPGANFKLRLCIEKAKQANMPKVNIDRAIERGLGKGEGNRIEEIIYEGFAPNKVGLLIKAATDNRQRTNATLKNILTSFGGALAGPGSVAYLFKTVGEIKSKKKDLTEDQYMELALEAGSDDIVIFEDFVVFYCDVNSLHMVKENLLRQNQEIVATDIVFKPQTTVEIEDKEVIQKIAALVDKLEAEDDILSVTTNIN